MVVRVEGGHAAACRGSNSERERGGAHSSLPRTVRFVSLGEERETKREEIAISPWRGGAPFPFSACAAHEKRDLSLLPRYDVSLILFPILFSPRGCLVRILILVFRFLGEYCNYVYTNC